MTLFLLTYHRDGSRPTEVEAIDDHDLALDLLRQAEEKARSRPELEVVLLTSASIDDIRQTHSRYFKSADELTGRRYTPREGLVIDVLSGVNPLEHAVWYGLEGDTASERNYAYSRDDCAAAFKRARARAEARASRLGPGAVVNDGGVDRGSGVLWDLYIGNSPTVGRS
jgi:hypothetical protein